MYRFSATLWLLVLHGTLAPWALGQQHDYHLEETPAVTWNGILSQDARMLALGRTSLLSSGPFAGSANPALVPENGSAELGLTGDVVRFEAFQYWGVNQGVVSRPDPLSARSWGLGGLAGHATAGNARLAAGWYVSNLLVFPPFSLREDYAYDEYDLYSGTFSGTEHTFFVAAALPRWRGLSFGGKLEYVSGSRQLTVSDFSESHFWFDDHWEWRQIEISQRETHDLRIFVPSLGLSWELTPTWSLAASATLPLRGDVDRTVRRAFDNPTDGVAIHEEQTATDQLHRPQRFRLGTSLELGIGREGRARVLAAAEGTFTRWSGYEYSVFADDQPRDLRDTVGLSTGVELALPEDDPRYFLRLGYRLDPQPPQLPPTTLHAWTGGAGYRLGQLTLDAGVAHYRGSSGGTDQSHYVLSLTLRAALKETR